jgi:hypothetical protein
MGKRLLRRLVVAVSMIGLIVPVPSLAAANAWETSTTTVRDINSGTVVPGSWSRVKVNDNGVFMTLKTTGLTPGDAVTIWWVVFNHPENCSHGILGLRCGEGDLMTPSVEAAVGYAAGHVIGSSGMAFFGDHLSVGNSTGFILGNGLTNPHGADFHLIVHDHGPAIPGRIHDMTHTFRGGCSNLDFGTGTPGPNTCTDLQAAPHEHTNFQ